MVKADHAAHLKASTSNDQGDADERTQRRKRILEKLDNMQRDAGYYDRDLSLGRKNKIQAILERIMRKN